MSYNFENSSRLYNRVLKQLEDNNKSKTEFYNQYGQYKLAPPKNPIRTRSIYTQQQSQYFGININHDEENNEDIHKFIQDSKTLRQKIYEKLQKKKKVNNNKIKVTQTTFRPNQVRQAYLKQNTATNNIGSLNNIKNYNKQKNSMQKQNYERTRIKTQRDREKRKIMTEVDQANALWDQKVEKTISQLDFHERQQKTVANRKQTTKKLQQQKKQKQLEGCTFKPKLTKYKPKRP